MIVFIILPTETPFRLANLRTIWAQRNDHTDSLSIIAFQVPVKLFEKPELITSKHLSSIVKATDQIDLVAGLHDARAAQWNWQVPEGDFSR